MGLRTNWENGQIRSKMTKNLIIIGWVHKIGNSSLKQRYRAILVLRNNETRKSTMKEVARLRILKKIRRLLVETSESNIFEAIDWLKMSRIFARKFRVLNLCLRMELRYWLKRGNLGI